MNVLTMELQNVFVDVLYKRSKGDSYSVTSRTIQPPDSPEVDLRQVLMINEEAKESLDLLPYLSIKEVEQIKEVIEREHAE